MKSSCAMREIAIPATPPNMPNLVGFCSCFVFFIDSEPRLAKPVSSQFFAHRLLAGIRAAEADKIRLSDDDWKELCELLRTSEVGFVPELGSVDADGTRHQYHVPNSLGAGYVGAILEAQLISTGQGEAAEHAVISPPADSADETSEPAQAAE